MSSVLAADLFDETLAVVTSKPDFLALPEEDKQLVLKEITERAIEYNDTDSARALKESANRFNELTSIARDRATPSPEFLGKVFEGWNDKGSREERLAQIGAFRKRAKDLAFEEDFLNARDIEYGASLILDAEERKVRGEDTGYFGDLGARALESFVVPLSSFFNTLSGDSPEEVAEKARRFSVESFEENIATDELGNPLDPTFGQNLASGVGSLGSTVSVAVGSGLVGAAVSGGNPFAAAAFSVAGSLSVNSSMRFQEGFSQEYAQSGDIEAAVNAGISALPAAGIDVVADKFLLGKFGLGKFNKSVKAAKTAKEKAKAIEEALKFRRTKDVLTGFAFEGGTEVLGDLVATYGQIASTGRQELAPSSSELAETFLIGGIIGGAVSGVGSVNTRRLINGLNQDVSQYTKLVQEGRLSEAAELAASRKLSERAGIDAPQPETTTDQDNAQSEENDQSTGPTAQERGTEQDRTQEQGTDQDSQQTSVAEEGGASLPRLSAAQFAQSLSSSSGTIKQGFDEGSNYTENGVEVTLKDQDVTDGYLNGIQVAGDIELEFIGVKDLAERGKGKASAELDRITALADERDMSISLVIDSDGATSGESETKGLSNSELAKFYKNKGFIFDDGNFGYRPRKSEDASKLIKKTISSETVSTSSIEEQINGSRDHDHSSPEDMFEAYRFGNLVEGYHEGGDDKVYYYDGKNRPVEVTGIKSEFNYDSGRFEIQPINESPKESAPAPDPTFTPANDRLHIGNDGTRVADGKLVRIEGNELIVRGPRGAVIKRQKLPSEITPEAKEVLISKTADEILRTGKPTVKKFNPDGVVKRANVRKSEEEAQLPASNAELVAEVDEDTGEPSDGSNETQAAQKLARDARTNAQKAVKFKPRTQVEKPIFGRLRNIIPGISALAKEKPLSVQKIAEIADNVNRSRRQSQDGPEFRELSPEIDLELQQLEEQARQAYFVEKQDQLGEDFPEAFKDSNATIKELRQLINELRDAKKDTPTENDWRPLVETHLEFLPPAEEVLPEGLSQNLVDFYNAAIEHIQSIDLDSLSQAETRDLFISLDSIVTDRSPSRIFDAYASAEASRRVNEVARGKGKFRSVFARLLGVEHERVGRFFNAGRGFENVLKNMSAHEQGRAILRHYTQDFENGENQFLIDKKEFEGFFEKLFDRTLRKELKKNPMASIRVGLVSDIVQAMDGQDPNKSVQQTLSKIRDSLAKQIEPVKRRPLSKQAVGERQKRIQAEKTLAELNSFMGQIDESSDTLFEDLLARSEEWLTQPEKEFLRETREWFAQRRADVKFITEAVIGRPFQGIENYMPQMWLGDGNAEVNPDVLLDSSNMDGVSGIPPHLNLSTKESGNLRERTTTQTAPEGMMYVPDAVYKFTNAANATLYDINTLMERKIVNKTFNETNKVVLMDAMDGRAENVKALQDNFKIRASEQLEAHKGANAFTAVLGWGYRRLSGRVLSALHQPFSQWISPVSHFLTLNPRFAGIIPKAMQLGFQVKRKAEGSVAYEHIKNKVPTLIDRNFVGERVIKKEARQPIQPAGFPGKAFQLINGFLDDLNEKVLFQPMKWGDTLSADGLYFANLYRIMKNDGKVSTWAEFEEAIPDASESDIRRAKIDTEANIAPSANNQRGYLAASKTAGYTALRMLFLPFTSHRLNAVNETWTSMRDLVTGGQGMSKEERARAAQNIVAFGVQAASFAAVKFGIGMAMYSAVKGMMNFDEEDDKKLIEAEKKLIEAKANGDKEQELYWTAELQAMRNVRKIIKNKDKKKLSGEAATHAIIRDIIGNTLYVAVPDQMVNFTGYVIDQMRSEDFKRWKEDEAQLINESIKNETDEDEILRLKLAKRDLEAMELLKTGHRPMGFFDNLGSFGSVLEPAATNIAEAFDTVFDEANEFSGNEVLLSLGLFGVGQADLTGMMKDLEKVQEARQKAEAEDKKRREKLLEEEVEQLSGATLSL